MKRILTLIALAAILAACTPKPEQIAPYLAQTLTAWPTNTPYPTLTLNPTYTPLPALPTYTPQPTLTARVVVVTATGTPTPLYTPTITNTPEPTKDRLTSEKSAGIYLVGVDIAPGIWRNNGTDDSCYWEVTTKTGDYVSNHYGMGGGTMYIPATAFQVRVEKECGKWTYLGE
jgi:hypothetical protein